MGFAPVFRISLPTAKALMAIDAARAAMGSLPVSPQLVVSLRESARLLSTHYSTQIEGNRLTLPEVEKVIAGAGGFPGRERDKNEVLRYYKASDKAEAMAAFKRPLMEKDVQLLHGLAFEGKNNPTPYRDGQNVIRDSAGGGIVYMPPEAKDVPELMGELISWINSEIKQENLPIPIIAALTHYQFATIHPYYDGNGRTARLLTTMILQRCGYGLNGIYSLEEYYARNLQAYYQVLDIGESHNYYMGRAESDVSQFVQFFCEGMADAFDKIRARTVDIGEPDSTVDVSILRDLRPMQRQALGLFTQSRIVTSAEIAQYLGIPLRKAREQSTKWVEEGFLKIENPSKKARSYKLADKYENAVA